jgi:cholesterol transport system auxiliary component
MTRHASLRAAAWLNRCLLVVGVLALAACSSGSVPRDSYYRLGELSTPAPLEGGPIPGVIDVPPFRAAGIVNERAILFRDGPSELSQYSYNHWFEPPGALLQRATIDTLRSAKAFDAVTSPELRLDRDYELLGNLRRFEHVPATSSVVVEIDVSLRRVRGNQSLILRTYSAEVPAPGPGAGAAVSGFSKALDQIFTELLNDLMEFKLDAAAS